jgi:hypothetical protein
MAGLRLGSWRRCYFTVACADLVGRHRSPSRYRDNVMSLTLYWEQRLQGAKLIQFFDANRAAWLTAARAAMPYTKSRFPQGAPIRRDDVAQFLVNVIEVDRNFKNHLATNKLTQKYWANHFADLIIDRTWNEITNEGRPP